MCENGADHSANVQPPICCLMCDYTIVEQLFCEQPTDAENKLTGKWMQVHRLFAEITCTSLNHFLNNTVYPG